MSTRIARAFYFVRKLLLVSAGTVAASGLVNPPRSLAQSPDASLAHNISAQVQRDNIEQVMASFLAAFANRDVRPSVSFLGSWPKSATEVEGFWIQQVGGAAAGVNPRSI